MLSNTADSEMPFLGLDWRSPGDKWVRTEFGWKRLSDIRNSLNAQLVSQLRRCSPRSTPRAGLSRRGSPTREEREERGAQRLSESSSALREERVKQMYHLLSQRCVSARKSSRENNHYATISDAVNKLNFLVVLQDENCFPFVCEVMALLYEQCYWSLSGSFQTTLLRVTDAAKETALETRKHTGVVVKMIDKGITTLEKGRKHQMTGFAVRNIDTKIKSLLKMKRHLQNTLQDDSHHSTQGFGSLPDDCLRHIISFLSHPRDVLNLGQTNSKLQLLTEENWVWRGLAKHHYGKDRAMALLPTGLDPEVPRSVESRDWKTMFMGEYNVMSSRKRLRVETFDAVQLCTGCNTVFWKSYDHPCCATTTYNNHATGEFRELTTPGGAPVPSEGLTSEQFLSLFRH